MQASHQAACWTPHCSQTLPATLLEAAVPVDIRFPTAWQLRLMTSLHQPLFCKTLPLGPITAEPGVPFSSTGSMHSSARWQLHMYTRQQSKNTEWFCPVLELSGCASLPSNNQSINCDITNSSFVLDGCVPSFASQQIGDSPSAEVVEGRSGTCSTWRSSYEGCVTSES